MTRNYSRYEIVACPTCHAPISQPCRGGRLRTQLTIPHCARRRLVNNAQQRLEDSRSLVSKPPVEEIIRFNGGEKTMWIRVTVNGTAEWINSQHIRRIQYGRAGQCQIVYTTKDIVTVDQPLESVMEALGYKTPPAPKLETHEIPMLERDESSSDFSGLAPPVGED